jgi:hypothetical protein
MRFLCKLEVAAGHDDVPVPLGRQMVHDSQADAFVASSHDDVLEGLHKIFSMRYDNFRCG